MKIQQVEELVGITKKNIRFYEDQGLLSPIRSENGYREYHTENVKRLKQIKFLRKLYVPIEDIRLVVQNKQTLDECLKRQLREIERKKADLDEIQLISENLMKKSTASEPITLEQLDVDECLENIARLEKEGKTFMNVSITDIHRKKTVGSVIGAVIMIAIMAFLAAMIWWGNATEPLPLALFIVLFAFPILIIVCVIVVLLQRIEEIQRGEEDEAAKY